MLAILELYENSTQEQQRKVRSILFKIKISDYLPLLLIYAALLLFFAFPIAAGVINYPFVPIAVTIMPIVGSILFTVIASLYYVLHYQIKKETDQLTINQDLLSQKQRDQPSKEGGVEATPSHLLSEQPRPTRVPLPSKRGDREEEIELTSPSSSQISLTKDSNR